MKLNPKKCTFGAEEEVFLGHIVNMKGIKVCPEKAEAVIKLQSPRTLKEVQSLNGKLASLNSRGRKGIPRHEAMHRGTANANRPKTKRGTNNILLCSQRSEGQSIQRPPLFESDHFIYWKNRFETYVKAKDLDLWHIILNGDFPSLAKNEVTQILEVVPFEEQSDDLKNKLAKYNEAKMVLYNALPKKEYERIFMCKTAKDIWQSLSIIHQGNSQVKDNKIDLLVQQYEQFTILKEESIDSSFARFNTIITSLKPLDESFSSKNYVRKFLRALHPKWRAKVMAIEESKDLSSLALDELIGNLKVHEVVMEKDSKIYKGKKERFKSIALKAKKESSDDETLTSGSDDEEYAMAVRNFKKFFRRKGKFVRQPREEKKSFRQRDEKKGKSDRKCFRCGDLNHLIGDCPKPTRNKDQKAFIGGSWSNSENDAEEKTNDETCLMAQSSNGVTLNSSYYSDNASSLDNDTMQIEYDSLCEISLKIINKNKTLKTKRDLLEKEVLELNEKIKKLERSKEIDIACKSCQELKLENAKLKETQVKFVKFDKSANSLREMLNNQKSSSCKIGLGFNSNKASTSETKPISFVGSSAEKATDGSTIKAHGSTIPGSVSRMSGEKLTEHVFSPPMSSRSDFVITRKKLIHNKIDDSKKLSLKPLLKSGIGYVKTESRLKTPPPRINISSQPRYNTPQPRRNSREPIHQNLYPMN
ncbi:zf-CCHC domain-containing protein [Tanacetum coccineum]